MYNCLYTVDVSVWFVSGLSYRGNLRKPWDDKLTFTGGKVKKNKITAITAICIAEVWIVLLTMYSSGVPLVNIQLQAHERISPERTDTPSYSFTRWNYSFTSHKRDWTLHWSLGFYFYGATARSHWFTILFLMTVHHIMQQWGQTRLLVTWTLEEGEIWKLWFPWWNAHFLESASGTPALLMNHCNKPHVTSIISSDPNSICLTVLV